MKALIKIMRYIICKMKIPNIPCKVGLGVVSLWLCWWLIRWALLINQQIHAQQRSGRPKEPKSTLPHLPEDRDGKKYREIIQRRWTLHDITSQQGLWEGISEQDLYTNGFEVTPQLPLRTFNPRNSVGMTSRPLTLDNMTFSEAEARMVELSRSSHLRCLQTVRVGNPGDGGWNVCTSSVFRPLAAGIVYSFGINNDFSFDDDMGRKFNSSVSSFDPSMNTKTHRRNDNVYFYNLGLSGMDEAGQAAGGWDTLTLKSTMEKLGHGDKAIDMLKLDIENSEYEVFRQVLPTGILGHVKQLAFELHLMKFSHGKQNFYDIYLMLLELERQGFRRFSSVLNTAGRRNSYRSGRVIEGCCYNMHYVNLRFLYTDIERQKYT